MAVTFFLKNQNITEKTKMQQRGDMDHNFTLYFSFFSQNSFEFPLLILYRNLMLCNQIVYMQEVHPQSQKPNKYAKISLDDRIRLAALVLEDSFSIAKSAKKVGIKLSTAKLIIKKYKDQGTFFESRMEKRKRVENQETLLESHLENNQNLSQTEGDMMTFCPPSTQVCYFVEMQTGLLYFPMAYNQTAGYYQ